MAPPGLIGITFVDFCGKAMVSHVSYDSPLHGWIFLEDVLIAIDEIAVNEMQVKDIVQLLLHRKDKQRALVIMSTHAMTTTLSTREPSEIMI
jgi:C-terminal processing protease CtpA/Prc